MSARDEVIRLSELNEGRSKYGEFIKALDAYRDEVLRAVQDERDMLTALEAAGVDNWSGYGYALDLLRDLQSNG